jgi:hypothetical protein
LAFTLYYAVDVSHFNNDFEDKMIQFYLQGLERHGAFRLGSGRIKFDKAKILFQQAMPMAFLRYAIGSGTGLFYMDKEGQRAGRFH